jgi:transposase
VKAAAPRAKISRGGLERAPSEIVVDHLIGTRVAAGHEVSWSAANNAVLAEGRRRLIITSGVYEHVWRHTRFGDCTSLSSSTSPHLTSARGKTGPARLLDMAEGRSKAAFEQWLAYRPGEWAKAIEVVAMDGFTGFETASDEELPDAVLVMDPFHIARRAGDAHDRTRQRVRYDTLGHRGHGGDRSTVSAAPCTPA